MPLFRLIPFQAPRAADLTLTGSVELTGPVLRVDYLLSGDLLQITVPEPVADRARRDDLWRHTCFELFAGPRDQTRYLEINVSPSGDWNTYSFTSYREGMALLPVAHFESHCKRRSATELELRFSLELAAADAVGPLHDLAITAVIEHSDGAKSYWALTHTSDRPDFHKRDSFILTAPK